MNRTQAINLIRYAAYHGDQKEAQRIYLENRVSIQSYRAAYKSGVKLRELGMKCGCVECDQKEKMQ